MSLAKDTYHSKYLVRQWAELPSFSYRSSVSKAAWPPGSPFSMPAAPPDTVPSMVLWLGVQPRSSWCWWWLGHCHCPGWSQPHARPGCARPGCTHGWLERRQQLSLGAFGFVCSGLFWGKPKPELHHPPAVVASFVSSLQKVVLPWHDSLQVFPSLSDPCHPSWRSCGSLLLSPCPSAVPVPVSQHALYKQGLRAVSALEAWDLISVSDPVHC